MTKLLSDEQIEELYFTELDNRTLSFARAIEAAVLEAQAGQEEVGYVGEYVLPTKNLKAGTPLYAAPVVQPGMVPKLRDILQMLLQEPDTKAALFKAEDALREMIAAAEGKK